VPHKYLDCAVEELVNSWYQERMVDDGGFPLGSQSGVTYPIQVLYCGNCSLPIEYCEYYPEYEKCKLWLERNMPTEFERVVKLGEKEDGEGGGGEEEKKRQKRGGKGIMKARKKEDGPKQVCVSRAPRGKKKSVTVVTGLSTFDIDLKVASKFFGTKFACGSSVTGDDEIVIQGDVKDELFDIIPEKWPEIDEDSIEDLGDQKR
jgi:density-regulated protein DRP1